MQQDLNLMPELSAAEDEARLENAWAELQRHAGLVVIGKREGRYVVASGLRGKGDLADHSPDYATAEHAEEAAGAVVKETGWMRWPRKGAVQDWDATIDEDSLDPFE